VSYQQPPDRQSDAAGPPPGWYRDPDGLPGVRWWDGTQWTPHAQPLPRTRQETQSSYPDAAATPASGYWTYRPRSSGPQRYGERPSRPSYRPDPQPASQPPYPPQGQPSPQVTAQRRRLRNSWPHRRRVLTALSVMAGFFLFVVIAAAAGSAERQSASSAAAASSAASPSAPSSPSAALVAARTVATFTGSGIENTPRFTVTATWKLEYSFICANEGGQGNFVVSEDGGSDFNGVSVNELSSGRSGSALAYGDSGTRYLAIDSECAWKVKVVDEP
jgi:hypothetical protein